jgi:hypothetical protein
MVHGSGGIIGKSSVRHPFSTSGSGIQNLKASRRGGIPYSTLNVGRSMFEILFPPTVLSVFCGKIFSMLILSGEKTI